MMVKQTAGRDQLGAFAPKFAQLNDDVLFGEVWSREDKLSLRDRSLVTVVSLVAQGLVDSSFQYHLQSAKNNGITKEEIAEILTHAAFYAGWPKAWAAFRMAVQVWKEDDGTEDAKTLHARNMLFPIGASNDGFAKYFRDTDAEVVYGKMNAIDLEGNVQILIPSNIEKIRYEMETPHPTVFVKREIYKKYGVFQLKYKIAADYELMLMVHKNVLPLATLTRSKSNRERRGAAPCCHRRTTSESFWSRSDSGPQSWA